MALGAQRSGGKVCWGNHGAGEPCVWEDDPVVQRFNEPKGEKMATKYKVVEPTPEETIDYVKVRLVDDGDATLEVYVDGEWQALLWLNDKGKVEFGYLTQAERDLLPGLTFDSDGEIEVEE